MQLHLLRHGRAEDEGPGASDLARKLTPRGRAEVQQVLERVRRAGAVPSLILSSPYVRAFESAEIAAKILGYAGTIIRTDALVPISAPRRIWDEIRSQQTESQILLAGHQPLLGQLLANLLGAPALQVAMRPATLVRIDVDHFGAEPHGVLHWVLPPELAAE